MNVAEIFFSPPWEPLRGEKFGSCARYVCRVLIFFLLPRLTFHVKYRAQLAHGLGVTPAHGLVSLLHWDGGFSGRPPRNAVSIASFTKRPQLEVGVARIRSTGSSSL